jgi:hypothetical protein
MWVFGYGSLSHLADPPGQLFVVLPIGAATHLCHPPVLAEAGCSIVRGCPVIFQW